LVPDARGHPIRRALDSVLDDWGVLEVVLSNDAGLPEAAATIQRLVTRWNVPHEQITFDKLGIGRNFPNHLARYGITTAIPYAGEGRTQDPNLFSTVYSGIFLQNRELRDHTGGVAPGAVSPQGADGSTC